MWHLFSVYLYDASLILCCTIAILWGGRDERIGGAIAIAASGATAAILPISWAFGISHARYLFLIVGLATLFAFDRLMVRSPKRWPIIATGFQLATVILQLTAIMEPSVAGHILLIRGKFAYPILIALAVGSIRHWRMRRTLQGAPWISPGRPGKVSLVERN